MRSHLKLLAAVLSVSLIGGCAAKSGEESSQTDSTSSSAVISSVIPETSSTPEESAPGQKLTDEEMALVSELKIKSFAGLDGETLRAEDANSVFDAAKEHTEVGSPGVKYSSAVFSEPDFGAEEEPEIVSTVLRYDFAYLRYRRSLFYLGERLDDEAEQNMLNGLPEEKWFKVRAGDRLECGLTVKQAVYERFPVETMSNVRDNYIEFDGELTMEGLLFTVKNDSDYLVNMGDLTFTPDPTKTSGIPDSTTYIKPDYLTTRTMYSSSGPYAFADGSTTWVVGTADDIDRDYIFGDDVVARVKLTLTNIRYGGIVSVELPAFYAEIVDIDRVD